MTDELPDTSTIQLIESHLGESFKFQNLHPWHVRFRRRYAQKTLSLPSAFKLTTTSGRAYKLYAGAHKRRFEHMVTRASQAAKTGLPPGILWESEQALLVEYIQGLQVEFGVDKFAASLGHAMASLHQIEQKPYNSEKTLKGVSRDLKLLSEAGVIGRNAGQYRHVLEQALPGNLFVSLDYSDIKPGNFLWDARGQLRFVDLGAFRANRPAGQYLCGSFYLKQIDRRTFAEAYLEAGGLSQVVEHASCLRMLNCIWTAALYVRKMREVPAYLPLHKLSYRLLIRYLLREFRRLSRISDADLISI